MKPEYYFLTRRGFSPVINVRHRVIRRLSDTILKILVYPMTVDDIQYKIGHTHQNISASLRRLTKKGKVRCVGEEWELT